VNKKTIGMIAYSEYSGDPRIRREAEAAVEANFNVNMLVLCEEKDQPDLINGVRLIYLGMSQYRGSSNLKYILSYISFFMRLLAHFFINPLSYSLIHVNNMPDFLVFSAIIPKLFGTKIILDYHDAMPETYRIKISGIFSNVIYKALLFQERISCLFVDQIITVHEIAKTDFLIPHGINRSKIETITNLADPNLFFPATSSPVSSDKFNLIYHGTIAPRFGLIKILDSVEKLIKVFPYFRFDIYGQGDDVYNLENSIETKNLATWVKYHGQIPLNTLPEKIRAASLGLVSYNYSVTTNLMLPLKLLEYVACEIPAITVKNKAICHYFYEGELAYYEWDSPDSFYNELCYLIQNPSKIEELRIKIKEVNRRLNWGLEKKKYQELLIKMTGNKK